MNRNADGETDPKARRPPRPVRLARPKSVIGTPASSGPYARLRVNDVIRFREAERAWFLVHGAGMSIRTAASALGLSVTTTWRRERWFNDVTLNAHYGFPAGPPPQQRGTRAVPRGRPIVLPMDSADVIRDLRASGYSLADIAISAHTIPACVRRLAARMARQNPGETP